MLVSSNLFGSDTLTQLLARTDVWHYQTAGVAGSATVIPADTAGRYVRIQLPDGSGQLSLAEVQVSPKDNLAIGQTAAQSSDHATYYGLASRAVDGNTSGAWTAGSLTHTAEQGGTLADVLAQPGVTAYHQTGTAGRPTTVTVGKSGRYVRIQLVTTNATALRLAEVRVLR